MVKSMTGFGRATSEEGKERIFSLEMKSVNHRYLDMNIRMPRSMVSLEEKIRNIISSKLSRGKVDIFINYKDYAKNQGVAVLNEDLAKSYVNSLEQLKSLFPNMQDDLSLSLVARYPDVITIEEKSEDLEAIWEEINSLLNMAVENMISMRKVEGEKLASDILVKCSSIEEIVAFIEEKSEVIVASYKQKLEDRLKNLLGEVPVDENRVAMEVVVFADKASIDEEIIRLRSHINQLRKTLTLDEPIGRKLDFIVQEMNREANTIASKSTDLEITNKVIDIKNIIEKIREQVQNIE
ncbi:YicC/YloC family endoribonuclease [Clostridium perfringens]|uniref:YicC/YloC family endoribonuclease n=1 Tax=Clostridium perfringens TaxID=1502 RepID=UPI0022E6D134|nr:YicC/YloC family endoribonuclease [Clostridium perfringens]